MKVLQKELRIGEEKQERLTPELRTRILNEIGASRVEPSSAAAILQHSRIGGPPLVWGAAAVVILGGFILFPVLNKTREDARAPVAAVSSVSRPDVLLEDRSAQQPLGVPQNAQSGGVVASVPSPLTKLTPPLQLKSAADNFAKPLPDSSAINSAALDTLLRRVHKEASITVIVRNPETQSEAVEQMVKSAGGYVADNALTTDDGSRRSAQMTLRVPEPQFETILLQIAKLGMVRAKNITGQDITGQVSDAGQAESILQNEVQQSQARLIKLGTKAKWVDDEQARDLRIQLAQARARLQLLQKMATLSTISLTLYEKPEPLAPASSGFFSRLTGTTHDALASLATSIGALLTLLVWLLAYAPVWLPIVLVTRHFVRQSQHHKNANQP